MPTDLGGVKANSEAGNIGVCIMTTRKGRSRKLLSKESWKFMYFARNSAGDLRSRKKCCWGYVSIFENTTEKIKKVVTTLCSCSRKNTTGYSNHRVKVSVKATCLMLTFQTMTYTEGNNRTTLPIRNYATGNLTPWKGCQTGLCDPTQLQGSVHPPKL